MVPVRASRRRQQAHMRCSDTVWQAASLQYSLLYIHVHMLLIATSSPSLATTRRGLETTSHECGPVLESSIFKASVPGYEIRKLGRSTLLIHPLPAHEPPRRFSKYIKGYNGLSPTDHLFWLNPGDRLFGGRALLKSILINGIPSPFPPQPRRLTRLSCLIPTRGGSAAKAC